MPSAVQSYDVLLNITNDMPDAISVQLLRDYGRSGGMVVLLHPADSVTLVLESGSPYRYAFKSHTRVASVTVCSWRDTECSPAHLFATPVSEGAPVAAMPRSMVGITVDRIWRDNRIYIWSAS